MKFRLAIVLNVILLLLPASGCMYDYYYHATFIESPIKLIDTHNRENWFFSSILFAPDGTGLVTASKYNQVTMLDIATEEEVYSVNPHDRYVRFNAISSDGRYAISHAGQDREIEVWSTETGKMIRNLGAESTHHKFISISDDGRWLATYNRSRYIPVYIWSIETGDMMKLSNIPDLDENNPPQNTGISNGFFIKGDRFIATSTRSGYKKPMETITWSLDSGEILSRMDANTFMAIDPKHELIACRIYVPGERNDIQIWSVETGELLKTIHILKPKRGNRSSFRESAFTNDSKYFLFCSSPYSGASRIEIIDLEKGTIVNEVGSGKIFQIYDSTLIIEGYNWEKKKGILEFQDIDSGNTLYEIEVPPNYHEFKLDQRSNILSIIYTSQSGMQIPTQKIDFYSISKEEPQLISRLELDWQNDIIILPSGSEIIASYYDRSSSDKGKLFLKRISMKTGEILQNFKSIDDGIIGMKFSPDGKNLVTVGLDRTARILNAKTGELINTVEISDKFDSAEISPDCSTVILGRREYIYAKPDPMGILEIWSLESGKMIRSLEFEHTLGGYSISPDSTTFATNVNHTRGCIHVKGESAEVKLFSISTGEVIQTLQTKAHRLVGICFNNKGDYAALCGETWSSYDRLWLWNLKKNTIDVQAKDVTGNNIHFNYDDSIIAVNDWHLGLKIIYTNKKPSLFLISDQDSIDREMGSRSSFRSFDFSTKENIIVTISTFGRIKIWQL